MPLCKMGHFAYFYTFLRFSVRSCACFSCLDGLQESTNLHRIVHKWAIRAFVQYQL